MKNKLTTVEFKMDLTDNEFEQFTNFLSKIKKNRITQIISKTIHPKNKNTFTPRCSRITPSNKKKIN